MLLVLQSFILLLFCIFAFVPAVGYAYLKTNYPLGYVFYGDCMAEGFLFLLKTIGILSIFALFIWCLSGVTS